MGGKKKYGKQILPAQNQQSEKTGKNRNKQSEEEKRFVNLLHVYTIYKQKLRRLSKGEIKELLCYRFKSKRAAIQLCQEFMKAKHIPNEVDFEKNVGFLSVPRLMPLIALVAERAGYNMLPSLVKGVIFDHTPERFREKFAQLLVHGFWFLGRVISDSLSVKDQVNRGNIFNFIKGDMGFWWAGVKILDWNNYICQEFYSEHCYSFLINDPPKNRLYTNRAIINMHQHPLYFLTETDWDNFLATIKSVRHVRVLKPFLDSDSTICSLFSESSINTNASFPTDYQSSGSLISSLS